MASLWRKPRASSKSSSGVFPGVRMVTARGFSIGGFDEDKDEDEANDLLQDMFVRLWVKKTSIGKIGNVKVYFYTSIRSIVFNYLRRIKNQDAKLDSMLSIDVDIQFSAEDIITEKETNLKLKKTIATALNRLPLRQREIMYLRFYESLDYSQIVEITGIKYQSVVNHIHRAVQSLREEFKETDMIAA